MARVFVYDGRQIPDPDPNLSVDDVRKRLADFFPELVNSDVQERKEGEDTVYTFTRRLGTKGSPGRRKKPSVVEILRRVPEKHLAIFDLAHDLIAPDGEVSFDLATARQDELTLAVDEAEAYARATRRALETLQRLPAR